MKWKHVEHYVIEGFGLEPQMVREGLQSQTVVLTDAHETARSLDLSVSIQGAPLPVATMLLMRKWSGVPGADLGQLRGWLLRDVLDRSGVGTLSSLVREAMSRDWDGLTAGRRRGPDFTKSVIEELDGKISRISKLACQATALAARYLDPENRGESADQLMAAMRFSAGLPWFYAQDRLLELSGQQVAFDRDDPGVTAAVERLRRLAHVAADEWGIEPDLGGVRAVDDADYIRVQVADVVCGWARTVVYQHGLVELVRRFRLVLYNGTPLTLERASRLDRERAEHRELLRGAAARGWAA